MFTLTCKAVCVHYRVYLSARLNYWSVPLCLLVSLPVKYFMLSTSLCLPRNTAVLQRTLRKPGLKWIVPLEQTWYLPQSFLTPGCSNFEEPAKTRRGGNTNGLNRKKWGSMLCCTLLGSIEVQNFVFSISFYRFSHPCSRANGLTHDFSLSVSRIVSVKIRLMARHCAHLRMVS
jgi:hypothetical protein